MSVYSDIKIHDMKVRNQRRLGVGSPSDVTSFSPRHAVPDFLCKARGIQIFPEPVTAVSGARSEALQSTVQMVAVGRADDGPSITSQRGVK